MRRIRFCVGQPSSAGQGERSKLAREHRLRQKLFRRGSGFFENPVMACPICGERCTCPPLEDANGARVSVILDPDLYHSLDEHAAPPQTPRVSVLVDPDLPGAGEDHFAASLEEDPLAPDDDADGQFLGSSAREGLTGGTDGGTNRGTTHQPNLPGEPLADVVAAPNAASTNGSSSPAARPAPQASSQTDPGWREEVANRLDAYRSRRRRRTEQSLSLNFEQAESGAAADRSPSKLIRFPGPAIVGTSVLDQLMVAEPAIAEPEGAATTAPATASATAAAQPPVTAELTTEDLAAIAAAPPGEELAEPVEDWTSSATYEPEETAEPEAAPSLAMTLEGLEDANADAREHARFAKFVSPEREFVLELPLQPAPMSQRLLSTLVDGGLVFTATLLFGVTFFLFTEAAPTLRVVLPMLVVVPAFWCAYQYLFLVLAGATPGMFVAGLELTTFDDGLVDVRTRRWRATATVISCVSLGLGYLWSLVDEDSLTWHDRITRTMVAPERLL
jgi:uncharacterized RDD family membrane protein YckC